MLTVTENCRISPPTGCVGERHLPLTFFDAMWLVFFPVHHVFFYELPCSREHFTETIVPNLKHSLSITLRYFFPFASKLIVFPNPRDEKKAEIRHMEGDSVVVTFAECNDLDFNHLTGNHPRNCHEFYPLVPMLGRASKVCDEYVSIPIFSVQVTLFPNSGISIGISNHHSLCEAGTRFNFLTAWASIAKTGSDELFLARGQLPLYERVIKYPSSLDPIFFNQHGVETLDAQYQVPHLDNKTDKVRATLVLTQTRINRLKKWLQTQEPAVKYVSSFSVACAYVWSCLAKSRARIGELKDEKELERFIFPVDWKSRLDPPIPKSYFGNCLGPCTTNETKSTLLAGDKGFLTAAELIGNALSDTVKKKAGEVIKDAETWLERVFKPVSTTGVSGTPKINIYDVDFGWGKPKKHETPSIDYNGSISVNTCKESPHDIEIGLSLPAKQMDAFLSISKAELESTFYEHE